MPKIIPKIPEVFPDKFPGNFQNTIQYFGFFSREKILKNTGKLLMLDIDFGRYCSLNCPTCFRKSNIVDDALKGDLTYDELIKVIDEAMGLGLQSIKICGAGEPTQNSNFLRFLQDMTKRNIGVAVFTKGQVLGNDKEAKKFYHSYGIKSAQELCNKLSKLKVSFMLSFQSFDTGKQDKLVGNIKNHAFVRNQALINLVNAGFTKTNPTRLALELGPITKENYDEIFDLYIYARRRNIYLIPNFLMTSGKQIDKKFLKRHDLSNKQKYDLFIKIYRWNIQNGLQTIGQIKKEGVSCMPGIHPCNQIACGLYVTANGNVVGCPGFTEIEGNVKKEKLKDIWKKSQNYRTRKGVFNCKCPPKDGVVIPHDLYEKVLKNL